MTTTTRCRYCGAPLEQAPRGRPKQFCTDVHRRLYAKVMLSCESTEQPPAPLVLIDRTTPADKRMRALHAEMRSLTRSCYELANDLERRSDLPHHFWRFAAVGADLERSVDKNFHDIEGKL